MPDEIALDDKGNPLLDQFSADGFVDCAFRIAEIATNVKTHSLRMTASHRGELVGLRVIVHRGIRGGFDSDMNLIQDHVYRPAVEFIRTGVDSDALVTILRELYGMPPIPVRMADIIPFTGIALHKDDVDMETEPIKIKLFGCDSDEDVERDRYFESFFNLDLKGRFVFWNEKDPDYRVPLIQGITGP